MRSSAAAAMMVAVDTVTIPGVELLRAGTWHGSIDGKPAKVTVTVAQLADALKAAKDSEVDHAPLKVGHTSKVFGDGAPALGWLSNYRLADGGRRLVADLTDVPAKFAKLLPKAFRRRSAELAYGVRTPAGRRYSLAVTALSVLGVAPPAVKGLADLEHLYGLGDLDLEHDQVAVALSAGELDTDAVASLTAAIDALDALGLDEATRSRIAGELEEAAGLSDASIPPPANAPGQDDPNAGTSHEEPPAMPIDDKRIRELIGAAEGDDLEKMLEGIKAKADGAPELTADETAALEKFRKEQAEAADDNDGELVGAGALSQAVLAELKAAGLNVLTDELLEELRAPGVQLAEANRAAILDKAVREGRISPDERGKPAEGDKPATGFYALLAADEEATTALLASMKPRFSVVELGDATAPDAVEDAALDEFEATLGLPIDEPADA